MITMLAPPIILSRTVAERIFSGFAQRWITPKIVEKICLKLCIESHVPEVTAE